MVLGRENEYFCEHHGGLEKSLQDVVKFLTEGRIDDGCTKKKSFHALPCSLVCMMERALLQTMKETVGSFGSPE